jgi:hypothetical protein
MQPPQLARAHKPRRSSRPILETLPSVTTTELQISSIYYGKKLIIKPLKKIPNLESIKVSGTRVEFHFQPLHRGQRGRSEAARIKATKTGFFLRPLFLCNSCGRAIKRLYLHNHVFMCRFCCNGRYASRACNQHQRPVLAAARLNDFLATKPVWQRTRERLLKRFGPKVLQAQSAYSTEVRRDD